MNWSDLCGLDDSEVVDSVESGSHWCSESGRTEAHPAAESCPQIVKLSLGQKRLHLSPGPLVLQNMMFTWGHQAK